MQRICFYETLIDRAEIGDVAGDSFINFKDVLHLTPRYGDRSGIALFYLTKLQRTFRNRYVRKLFPTTRQNLRLQSSVSICQEVFCTT